MNYESLREDHFYDQNILDSEIIENDQNFLRVDEVDKDDEIPQNENILDEDIFKDILKEPKSVKYPNEAYADLMALVIKHKLNNKTGNAIIKFFNKHANHSQHLLSKSIEQGRKYMDNMDLPNLALHKTHVITYKEKDYYLHHHSLENCVRNILSIPDISQTFALNFEKLKVIISVIE